MKEGTESVVLGVDGCRHGWVCFSMSLQSRKTDVRVIRSFSEVMVYTPKPKSVAVDIPIGLPESGPRECDLTARKLLKKPRSNGVFPAPVRALLEARTFGAACRKSEQIQGKGVTKQTYALIPKIREVDDLITPAHQLWIREVHPEICFWAMNNRAAMTHKKSSRQGREERLTILRKLFPAIDARLLELQGKCKPDDVIDAAAAAWTALRLVNGEAKALSDPEYDRRGLWMEIVY